MLLVEAKTSSEGPIGRMQIRQAIGQLFDYRKTYLGSLANKIDLAILLPKQPSNSIIDLLKSIKINVLWFKKRGYHVTGFERSPGLSKLARENVDCKVIEGDFRKFDFSNFSYDAIILVGALVHISYKEFPAVFKRILKALKENGIILVSLNEGRGSNTDKTGRTFWLWHDSELRYIFKRLGLKVLEFNRQETKVGTRKIWLAYVLERN